MSAFPGNLRFCFGFELELRFVPGWIEVSFGLDFRPFSPVRGRNCPNWHEGVEITVFDSGIPPCPNRGPKTPGSKVGVEGSVGVRELFGHNSDTPLNRIESCSTNRFKPIQTKFPLSNPFFWHGFFFHPANLVLPIPGCSIGNQPSIPHQPWQQGFQGSSRDRSFCPAFQHAFREGVPITVMPLNNAPQLG